MGRSRWRDRLRLMGVVGAGIVLGIVVGALLVHLIVGSWGDI